jgi:Spy/CpxP family protein refolding chaperone
MKRNLTILAAIGAMVAAMAIAQTTTAPAAPATIKARLQKKLINALDLTATQKQQAKTILQATRQQVQPLTQQLQQDRQSLSTAIQAGNTAQIQQLSKAMGDLDGQVLALRAAGMAQFYALLTPDQKTKAVDFQQKVQQVLGAKGE